MSALIRFYGNMVVIYEFEEKSKLQIDRATFDQYFT